MREAKIFETNNVDIAAFLILEGIKLLECRSTDEGRKVVVMRFLDESQNCLDLERVYLNSEAKKFADIKKYLLKKIHECMRGE